MSKNSTKTYTTPLIFYGEGKLAIGLEPKILFILGLDSGTVYQGVDSTLDNYINMSLSEIASEGITGSGDNFEPDLLAGRWPGAIYKLTIDWEAFDPSNGTLSKENRDRDFWILVELDFTNVYTWEAGFEDIFRMKISSDDIEPRRAAETSKLLKDLEMGGWEIKDHHLTISGEGEEIVKYKLYDKSGVPTDSNVYKRVLKSVYGQDPST